MNLQVAHIFADNMVLQQGLPVPVWGTAAPGTNIAVTFNGKTENAKADADGKWLVQLPPMPASAEPAELKISSVTVPSGSPPDTLKFINILVGEVWVCSGQSNMELPLCDTRNSDIEIAAANFPGIRLFTVPKCTAQTPLPDIAPGQWYRCSPESVAQFSAAGYFFGRELHLNLHVPVGLINASWGGTVAEAWISRDSLFADPGLRQIIETYDRDVSDLPASMSRWQAELAALDARTSDTGDKGWPLGWADLPEPSGDWKEMNLPNYWQSQRLNFSGILWFRKVVDVPAAWAGKDLTLSIGAADKSDITYFNNVKIGSITMQQRPDSWSFLRAYTVPGSLVKAGKNIIAVRVHSDRYAGGMTGPAEIMNLTCSKGLAKESIPLNGTWRYAVEANYGFVTPPPPTAKSGQSKCSVYAF